MLSLVYRFGRFRLDAQARELIEDGRRVDLPLSTIDCLIHLIRHRDRPVGRDELASAVWGRVDVSEASLNHAVMRLRRHLGDTGNEQRVIRTVPRLGYRWVLDIDDTCAATGGPVTPGEYIEAAAPAHDALAPVHEEAATTPMRTAPSRGWSGILLGAAALALALLVVVLARDNARDQSSSTRAATTVLPFTIDAGAEWAWLRLGLMDLVTSHLQRAGITTVPSETTLALLAPGADRAVATPSTSPSVVAAATRSGEQWTVRLEHRADGAALFIETRDADPVRAARVAADELVIKLGRTPPQDGDDSEALVRETLRRRINAAVLAGQLEVARQLLDSADPSLRDHPDIALSQASLAFFSGRYEASRALAERVLGTLAVDAPAAVRARALGTLGAAQFRLGQLEEAERSYRASLALADAAADPGLSARAHIGIGGIASQRMQLDEAAGHYGRARLLHAMRDDAFGIAAVDLNLGMIALHRGQPATALVTLTHADQRFSTLRAEDALASTLAARADADILLLDNVDARATAERMKALEARLGNLRQRWELMIARAQVAISGGQLDDAERLLAQVLDASDTGEDVALRALANAALASSTLLRGRPQAALELATAALVPALQERSRAQYAQTWLVLCRALRSEGRTRDAANEVARLRAWSDADPTGALRSTAALAEAEQGWSEHRTDDALTRFAEAMQAALRREVPDEIVAIGEPYVRLLLAERRLDDAISVNSRIAEYAERDPRAAASAARVYAALGDSAASTRAQARARILAGQRSALLASDHAQPHESPLNP